MSMESPIRVLCVFSTLDRGGAESMCMNLYRHIDRKKVQFDFVKHTPMRGAFEEEIESLGGHIYIAPRYKIINQMHYERWWKTHLKDHLEHSIVHGHYFTISSVYFRVCKKFGRTTVAHSHCTNAPKVAQTNSVKAIIEKPFIKSINRYSDVRLACSTQAGFDVFGNADFTVLNNAIDAKRFRFNSKIAKKVRQDFSLGDALVVGNVSRFNLQKNPYGTLDIFRAVHERRPNSKLLWVGDGPMREEVQHKVADYALLDVVIFTGVRSDVERLLQAVDVFVFPSFYEGLGVAAVEAQAAGVKTLCSSAVPSEAKVTDLCEFLALDDIGVWANAICEVPAASTHPETTNQIIEAGYDIHQTTEWLQDFYLKLSEQ